MTTPPVLITLILMVSLFSCKNENTKIRTASKIEDRTISKIDINLFPAFNDYSVISIDKSSNTIQFKVDTTTKFFHQGDIAVFSMNLDSFRAHTLIDSFYSKSFLDSIKSKSMPKVTDGLFIFTVLRRGNVLDTIDSGNVYPKTLSTNVMSQLDYILQKTNDRNLKKYIDDLKTYF